MKKIIKTASEIILMISMVILSGACTENEFTDGDRFLLFYPDITDIGPSTSMSLEPTYHGAKPSDFRIYEIKFQGTRYQTECFKIDGDTGVLTVADTQDLPIGIYSISVSCMSAGEMYKFPELIKVNMMKPIPDGISVTPSRIELLLTQVNNVNSEEVFPTAQVVTDGDHVSINDYRIANVWREGQKMDDWTQFFAIDENTGLISVLKNQSFAAGVYVFDLRLMTAVVGATDEEGLFEKALSVDIISPPVELAYDPKVKRVEEGAGYLSEQPYFVASTKELVFSIKSVYPEDVPMTIDSNTGQLTLEASHGLSAGSRIQVSVRVANAYGLRDFDLIHEIEIVNFINPISKFSYNDSTLWNATAFSMRPVEMDGDEVRYEFVNLPDELSDLTIDSETGIISTHKGNVMPNGEYTVTVKASNDKGEMTDDISLKIIDNPYYFTKVSWGNNIGLDASAYASQHRIKDNDDVSVEIDRVNTDIKTWDKMSFEIVGGTVSVAGLATIDSRTGSVTVKPSLLTTMASKRVHAVIVKVVAGAGTSGETVRKIPVFFDFNAPRKYSSNSDAPVYTVEYTPFVFQCNPKKGGTYPAPEIKDADGNPVNDTDLSCIDMTFMRNAKYINVEGPDSHINGASGDDGTFLNGLWRDYYTSSDQSIPSSLNNAMPVYTYNNKYKKYLLAYINTQTRTLTVAANKWKDSEGNYADGIFEAEVIMGYPYTNGFTDAEGLKFYDISKSSSSKYKVDYKGKHPYKLYPFLIWFDTEF